MYKKRKEIKNLNDRFVLIRQLNLLSFYSIDNKKNKIIK